MWGLGTTRLYVLALFCPRCNCDFNTNGKFTIAKTLTIFSGSTYPDNSSQLDQTGASLSSVAQAKAPLKDDEAKDMEQWLQQDSAAAKDKSAGWFRS